MMASPASFAMAATSSITMSVAPALKRPKVLLSAFIALRLRFMRFILRLRERWPLFENGTRARGQPHLLSGEASPALVWRRMMQVHEIGRVQRFAAQPKLASHCQRRSASGQRLRAALRVPRVATGTPTPSAGTARRTWEEPQGSPLGNSHGGAQRDAGLWGRRCG